MDKRAKSRGPKPVLIEHAHRKCIALSYEQRKMYDGLQRLFLNDIHWYAFCGEPSCDPDAIATDDDDVAWIP
jgi:hypothetical protein